MACMSDRLRHAFGCREVSAGECDSSSPQSSGSHQPTKEILKIKMLRCVREVKFLRESDKSKYEMNEILFFFGIYFFIHYALCIHYCLYMFDVYDLTHCPKLL